ncbi:MAG: hypothetical protein IAE85_16670, partial [Anaerolinea sp.]|nr:hypothetical protein [Anaerolinea sp.]
MRIGQAPVSQGSYILIATVLLWRLAAPVLPASAQEPARWRTTLRVQTPAYSIDTHGVTVPGYGRDATPGAPALPVWRTVVELPPTGAYQISYQTPGAGLLAQQVDVPPAPLPQAAAGDLVGWTRGESAPAALPTLQRRDPAIYGVDVFYPAAPVVAGPEQWQQGRRLLAVAVYPFQVNPATRTLRYHPDVQIEISVEPAGDSASQPEGAAASLPANLPASTPGALRIRTGERGLYRLSYDDLQAAGVPLATADVSSFAIWYLGQPVASELVGDGDARFEPGELVVFYAQPYEGRYQRDNVYWLTYGGAAGLRMAGRAVTPTGSEPLVTTITQTLHVEFNREYRSDYARPQEADHWFDTPLSPALPTGVLTVTRSYDLALDDALQTGNVQIEATLQGATDRPQTPDQSVELRLNSHPLGRHQWEGLSYTTVLTTTAAAHLDGSPNRLHLVAALSQLPGITVYSFAPDWVKVRYPALADAEGDRILIDGTAAGANQVRVSGFSTPEVRVYDLRDANRPVRLLTSAAEPAGGGYAVSFWDADLPGPSYALSSLAALRAPLAVEADTPSAWGTTAHAADYLAVVHPSLWEAIDPLLARRAAEGLRIAKVDVQDIYDEWSYGR